MHGYKVLVLVSGGKDSCYNALLCQELGHQLVALGNLYPKDAHVEELDSYMYQTVGHGLIEAYAECTGLPLLRKRIVGSSVEQGLIYSGHGTQQGGDPGNTHVPEKEREREFGAGDTARRRDEVEDLEVLLQFAKDRFGIEAVSSGAIASDYQRSRVERICSKLKLISLAYMWHHPQSTLLQEMIMHDIDARLIKVAAAGLDPGRHLGKSLREMEAYLHKLREMYGINVCGEGGEYETLTLDCPLFKYGRIVIDEHEVVVAMPDSLAPVAWMRVTRFHVERKGSDADGRDARGGVIHVPDDYVTEGRADTPMELSPIIDGEDDALCGISVEASRRGKTMQTFHGHCTTPDGFETLLRKLKQRMEERGWRLETDCVFVTLFVDDMGRFAAVNDVYSRHFPPVNPPSRATLEKCGEGISIQVLCSSKLRNVLHVQSLSRWAPNCIGPYSQAVACGGMVRYSGQIALQPESSTVVRGGLEAEVARVSLTCNLLGQAMKIDWASTLLWSVLYVSDSFDSGILSRLFTGESDDAADSDGSCETDELLENGGPFSSRGVPGDASQYVEDYLSATKNTKVQVQAATMTLVVQCPCLPRNACIEIQSVHAGIESLQYVDPDSSSDEEEQEAQIAARAEHGWLQQLKYLEQSTPPLHVRAVYAPGKFAKVHMAWVAAPPSTIGAGSVVDCVAPVLEAAALTMDDLAFANGYTVDSEDRQQLEVALCAALGAPPFVIDVNAVSLFAPGDVEGQKATCAVELLFTA